MTKVFLSRMKKVGLPWLSRSVTSGRARQAARTSFSACWVTLRTPSVCPVEPGEELGQGKRRRPLLVPGEVGGGEHLGGAPRSAPAEEGGTVLEDAAGIGGDPLGVGLHGVEAGVVDQGGIEREAEAVGEHLHVAGQVGTQRLVAEEDDVRLVATAPSLAEVVEDAGEGVEL